MRNQTRSNGLPRLFGVEHTSPDSRSVLEADDLDFVVVNSVDHLHAEQVDIALDSGKHVLADKPLGMDTGEAAKLASKANKAGLKVAIGHMFRFTPHYEFVKERVDGGYLGRLYQVDAGYVHDMRPYWKTTPWRSDPKTPQNPWFGGTLHPIDVVHWVGGAVTHVFAAESKASVRGRVSDQRHRPRIAEVREWGNRQGLELLRNPAQPGFRDVLQRIRRRRKLLGKRGSQRSGVTY